MLVALATATAATATAALVAAKVYRPPSDVDRNSVYHSVDNGVLLSIRSSEKVLVPTETADAKVLAGDWVTCGLLQGVARRKVGDWLQKVNVDELEMSSVGMETLFGRPQDCYRLAQSMILGESVGTSLLDAALTKMGAARSVEKRLLEVTQTPLLGTWTLLMDASAMEKGSPRGNPLLNLAMSSDSVVKWAVENAAAVMNQPVEKPLGVRGKYVAILTGLKSSRPVHQVPEKNCHPSLTSGAECKLLRPQSDKHSYQHVRDVSVGTYRDATYVASSTKDVRAMQDRDRVRHNCMVLGVVLYAYIVACAAIVSKR